MVIEATSVPSLIPMAFKLAKQRGKVILLGSPRGLSPEIDFYTDVHKKGISIVGAHEINRTNFDERLAQVDFQDESVALTLLAQKRLQLRPLISALVSPTEAAKAYERLAQSKEELLLLAFDWQRLASS